MTKITNKQLEKFFEDIAIKYGFRTPELSEIRDLIELLKIDSLDRAEKLAKILYEEELIKLPEDEIINIVKGRV